MNTAYDDLQAKLAAAYDTNSFVQEATIDECMGVYAEPYLKDATNATNVTNLRNAGYTDAADKSCLSHEIVAHKVWHYTRSNLAFNPYQDITASGVKPDLAFTLSQMSYCRQALAGMCVLSNHSISSTRITDASYSKIYNQMKASGPPLDLQTATAAKTETGPRFCPTPCPSASAMSSFRPATRTGRRQLSRATTRSTRGRPAAAAPPPPRRLRRRVHRAVVDVTVPDDVTHRSIRLDHEDGRHLGGEQLVQLDLRQLRDAVPELPRQHLRARGSRGVL